MKNKTALILLIALILIKNADACTNFLITKGASADGASYITYSADSYELYGFLSYNHPAVYPDGAMLDIYDWDSGKYLGKIKQAAKTYRVVGNMNENQVAIGETTFGGREELVDPKGTIDYGSLIYIALQRSRTAREALNVMTSLAEEYGFCSEGESFSIADPNEVWILEMTGKGEGNKGAVWVARRIPDGYVSSHANQARITTFPMNDPDNCLYSKDVISFAREKGYFEGADKDFSFSDTYNPLEFGGIRYCEARVWSFFRRINPTMDKYISYIKGESLERMPLWIKADKKLSVRDIMSLMRDHYEGTELDLSNGIAAGPYKSPYRWRPLEWTSGGEKYFNERPISTPQTGFSFVAQCRSWLPNEIGGVLWFGLDDTYMTVYMPLYTCLEKVPHSVAQGTGSFTQFTWDSMWWTFNFVANYAYPKYSLIIGDILTEQQALEGEFSVNQDGVEKEALALYKESPARAAAYLSDYSTKQIEKTHSAWLKLGERLLAKYNDGVVKSEYGKPINVGYPEEFRKAMAAESGDKLKIKKLPGQDERIYADAIREAGHKLKEKKYEEAKELYSKALKAKPEDQAVKTYIEQIDKALSELNQIHDKYFNNSTIGQSKNGGSNGG